MRILLPNHFPLEGSGSGIYTQNVARELVKKGHAAYAITPAHDEQIGFPFEVESILFTPDGSSPQGEGRLPFNFPCFTTHPLSSTTFADLDAPQQASYIEAFGKAVVSAAETWQPDVIHAQHLWVTPYAAVPTGIPTVVTAHGTDLMGFRQYESWVEVARQGAKQAQAVIAISKQVETDAIELYELDPARVHRVMNGFDEDIFKVMDLRRAQVLSAHKIDPLPQILITFVGKLAHFKGVDVLLDAAAVYEQAFDSVTTLIIGDGELRDSLDAQAQRLGLKGVRFLGHQPQTEVARLLNVADLSIVPSRVEPFGLVAVEALACGTPVVATNEGGLPDFIDDRVGALVDVGDPAALANAIIDQVRSAAKQRKGPFAAEYAHQDFSWAVQVDKMVGIYEQVRGGL
jgi:glycosyltransferase involved in cell wall biosynthesis